MHNILPVIYALWQLKSYNGLCKGQEKKNVTTKKVCLLLFDQLILKAWITAPLDLFECGTFNFFSGAQLVC